jgi:polyhydroxyalkanoate synthesis repressor PhaR
MMPQPQNRSNPIVIKKYANRRLYNTDTSSYVTLDDLCQMIKQGEEIIVYDAKNGDDITRSVLTQIIVEQESKGGQNLLPTSFLRQLISFYGGNMQGLVPRYLEYTMQAFSKNQGELSEYMRKAMGGMGMGMTGMFPFSNAFEEMSKQNMAIFEQAMRMFSPFGGAGSAAQEKPAVQKAQGAPAQEPGPTSHLRPVPTPAREEEAPEPADEDEALDIHEEGEDAEEGGEDGQDDASIRQMKQRLDDLQKQIAALAKEEENQS